MTRLICALLVVACSSNDNSADTDRASEDLRTAQSSVSAKQEAVTTTGDEIERRRLQLLTEQQQLAVQEKSLADNRRQLGSAQGTLEQARTAYAAAVKERFAKLDAGLAGLSTRTDAASKDARAGLAARRDLLAAELEKATPRDLDTMFDAIERDLRAATP